MEFKKPKPKKNSTLKGRVIFPPKNEKQIIGVFNGQFVTVHDWDAINYLYKTGNFGKGSLSKGQPNYHINKDDIPKIMVNHQFENHMKWCDNISPQKYLASLPRNDFKLSLQSVSRFLESTFNDDNQESWKSWKEKQEQTCDNFKQTVNQPSVEFKTDSSDYKDEVFNNLVNEILHSRQIKRPNNLMLKSEEVIVLNPSSSCHLTDLSAASTSVVLKKLPIAPHESLNLNLEESFFLKSVLGCLNIVDLNLCEIKIPELWEKFNSIDKNFTERYISYNYYRNKGWVVRSGLKFGGDFLLYKDGPAYYHASYLVKVLDKRKKLTWREFIAMNRLVETFNKDLLLCEVLADETFVDKNDQPCPNHSVQEVLVRRWFPSRERVAHESTSN